MTTIVNKHTHVPNDDDVYIGRGSRWGNPFKIGEHGTRTEIIEKYRRYLWTMLTETDISDGEELTEALAALHGKTLVCFCSPDACHGDVLARAAAWAVLALQELNYQREQEAKDEIDAENAWLRYEENRGYNDGTDGVWT